MSRLKQVAKEFEDGQTKGAFEAVVEELFHDFYRARRRVYMFNFIRGIFFGAGSALGGTLIVALVLWILSFFINFPVIGQYFQQFERSVQQNTQQR